MVDSLEVLVTPQKNSPPAKQQTVSTCHLGLVFCSSLTHFVEGEGALVAGVDLGSAASREVKQLDESGNHLVFLLCVAQTAVASKTPAEHPLLGVQHQLSTHTHI